MQNNISKCNIDEKKDGENICNTFQLKFVIKQFNKNVRSQSFYGTK